MAAAALNFQDEGRREEGEEEGARGAELPSHSSQCFLSFLKAWDILSGFTSVFYGGWPNKPLLI